MSKSCYTCSDDQGMEVAIWLDDSSFIVLMAATWLALNGRNDEPWRGYQLHCYRQVCVGGLGVLDSGLEMLKPKERAQLATILEQFGRSVSSARSTELSGEDDVDVSPLDAELCRRGDSLAVEARPALTVVRLRLLLPFVVAFLRGFKGGPVGGEESLAWFDLWTVAAWSQNST